MRLTWLRIIALLFALVVVMASSCSAREADKAPIVDDNPGITSAVDTNPDPNVFEMDLVAKVATVEIIPGKKTAAWTYNGTVPGPFIDVAVGLLQPHHSRSHVPRHRDRRQPLREALRYDTHLDWPLGAL